ncbi:Prephenate dehydrogenase [Macleaya cordata]|uniref:Prephenate dehydrogenase n=1 Tax=Macleaya cordata TaxID=56857 RepID=A0A200Q5Y1_MACCD|nr:Prephenate dehydrogenase [Macleaya cordata]
MFSVSSLRSSKIRLLNPPSNHPPPISHYFPRLPPSILSLNPQKRAFKHRNLRIRAIDAAQPALPVQRLKRSTLFVDVLSVKEFPRNLFLQILPLEFDVLCTHPMFGPESGKNGWRGLPFVYDKVRIGNEKSRISRCEKFLNIFVQEGCRMVEMPCAEHDRSAAESQFITHTMGRVLEKFGLESTSINTKGYETLLNLVENTSGDSFDLYYGLFMYNKNAMEQLERLDMAFESLKKQLFGHLHDVLRKQLFENAEALEVTEQKPVLPKLLQNGVTVEPPTETMR